MGRRGKGEGTVYQRADGLWIGCVRTLVDGKVERKSVSAKTKGEAKARLDKLKGAPQVLDPSKTLGAYLDEWLPVHRLTLNSEASFEFYRSAIEVHIKPRLGQIRLAALTTQHVDQCLTQMAADGKGQRTRHKVRTTLGTACKRAVKLGLLQENVVDNAIKTKQPKSKAHSWTQEEAERFMKDPRVRASKWWPFVVLGLSTGLRPGELLGLQWSDLDLSNKDVGVVCVRRILREVDSKTNLADKTKTEAGSRTLGISSFVVKVLIGHREQLLARGQSALPQVFPNADGGYYQKGNVRRDLYELQKLVGVPKLTLHQMRHTHATLLIKDKEPLAVVQARLGHSHPNMTGLYSHVIPGMDASAAKSIERSLGLTTGT